MKDLIVLAIIIIVLGLAIGYIIKAKKNGTKCIGCPSGGNCCTAKKSDESCYCDCCDCNSDEK